MTGVEKLEGWFASGRLVRPSAGEGNFVDLVRALASLGGVEGLGTGTNAEALKHTIGAAEHYVFVLVDGMGADMVRGLPEGGFMRSHLVRELRSVFLSTTAAALTTLATGQWPCVHGVPGWWTYLPERDINTVPLPFVQRATNRPLRKLGVTAEELFPVPSFWPRFKHELLSVLPSKLRGTVYSRYLSAETRTAGYGSLAGALAKAREAALSAEAASFTYLYLPQLDSVMHAKGTRHEDAAALLAELDGRLGDLADALAGRARIVVSADHGQTDVPDERRFVLAEGDSLRLCLRCQPSGEPSVPIFHVRPGHEERFAEELEGRFGEYFALLTTDEVENLRLLGPDNLSPIMRQRLGTYMGIAREPIKLYIQPLSGSNPQYIGLHGGLTHAEMVVPLIVA